MSPRGPIRAAGGGRPARRLVDFGIGDGENELDIVVDKSLHRVRLDAIGSHIPWAEQGPHAGV